MNNQANKPINIADMLNEHLNSKLPKKDEIMHKFRFKEPKFYDYPDPHAFSYWLANIECYFDNYKMSDLSKIWFAELRLVRPTKIYWNFITNGHKELRRKPIESIKVKLKEIYFPDFYMNHLVDELHNPHKSRHIVSSKDGEL